jgi:hypothetical protein
MRKHVLSVDDVEHAQESPGAMRHPVENSSCASLVVGICSMTSSRSKRRGLVVRICICFAKSSMQTHATDLQSDRASHTPSGSTAGCETCGAVALHGVVCCARKSVCSEPTILSSFPNEWGARATICSAAPGTHLQMRGPERASGEPYCPLDSQTSNSRCKPTAACVFGERDSGFAWLYSSFFEDIMLDHLGAARVCVRSTRQRFCVVIFKKACVLFRRHYA